MAALFRGVRGRQTERQLLTWTEQDVIDHISQIRALSREIERAGRVIKANHINGQTIAEHGGVSQDIVAAMFENKARQKRFVSLTKEWLMTQSNGIQVRLSDGRILVLSDQNSPVISLDMPVTAVRRIIETHFGIPPNSSEVMDTRGRHLVEERSLSGNSMRWGSEIFVNLSPPVLPSDVTITEAPDMVTQESLPSQPRAQMPCNPNHGMTASSMALHVRDCLRRRQFEVYCPDPSCSCLWPWEFCLKVAAFNRVAKAKLNERRETNRDATMMTVKNCPRCGVPVSKNPGVRHSRVRCPMSCSGDFCWRCLERWTASGFGWCGNGGCDTQVLEQAEIKTHGKVRFPTARSCPRCETVVVHRDACKHVHCSGCSLQFCMSCLKPNERGWQCGSYSDPCDMAPKQQS